jgi:DeoR/GlpR family transcriptional regulator of sugar metabolism
MKENRKLLNQKRKKYILNLIDKDGGVTTVDLADKLGVSLSTIRRDLNSLEKNGLILKTHGGAVPRSFSTSYEPPYHLKSHLQKREKELIGKLASSFIKKEDTVIFDSGTTIFQVAHYSREKQFSAIALDLPVAMELANNPSIDLIILGGKVRAGIYAIIGTFAEEILRKLYVDSFFMGADAIHLQKGVTNATLAEVPLKQLAIQMAKEVILVTDSSKFDKISLAHVCELQKVDKIITDENLSPDIFRQLKEMEIEVIIAK